MDHVGAGYVDDQEATSATLVNGWLRTGDLCYFDNDGFLYVVDRLKELIKYKGYQVTNLSLKTSVTCFTNIKYKLFSVILFVPMLLLFDVIYSKALKTMCIAGCSCGVRKMALVSPRDK